MKLINGAGVKLRLSGLEVVGAQGSAAKLASLRTLASTDPTRSHSITPVSFSAIVEALEKIVEDGKVDTTELEALKTQWANLKVLYANLSQSAAALRYTSPDNDGYRHWVAMKQSYDQLADQMEAVLSGTSTDLDYKPFIGAANALQNAMLQELYGGEPSVSVRLSTHTFHFSKRGKPIDSEESCRVDVILTGVSGTISLTVGGDEPIQPTFPYYIPVDRMTSNALLVTASVGGLSDSDVITKLVDGAANPEFVKGGFTIDNPPTEAPEGTLLDGDFFLDKNTLIPYSYVDGEWVATDKNVPNWGQVLAETLPVAVQTDKTIAEGSFIYLYVQNLSAHNLSAHDISVSGSLQSLNYEHVEGSQYASKGWKLIGDTDTVDTYGLIASHALLYEAEISGGHIDIYDDTSRYFYTTEAKNGPHILATGDAKYWSLVDLWKADKPSPNPGFADIGMSFPYITHPITAVYGNESYDIMMVDSSSGRYVGDNALDYLDDASDPSINPKTAKTNVYGVNQFQFDPGSVGKSYRITAEYNDVTYWDKSVTVTRENRFDLVYTLPTRLPLGTKITIQQTGGSPIILWYPEAKVVVPVPDKYKNKSQTTDVYHSYLLYHRDATSESDFVYVGDLYQTQDLKVTWNEDGKIWCDTSTYQRYANVGELLAKLKDFYGTYQSDAGTVIYGDVTYSPVKSLKLSADKLYIMSGFSAPVIYDASDYAPKALSIDVQTKASIAGIGALNITAAASSSQIGTEENPFFLIYGKNFVGGFPYVGMISFFWRDSAPPGWAVCDGADPISESSPLGKLWAAMYGQGQVPIPQKWLLTYKDGYYFLNLHVSQQYRAIGYDGTSYVHTSEESLMLVPTSSGQAVGTYIEQSLPSITGKISNIQAERGYSKQTATGPFSVLNYSGNSDSGEGHDRAFELRFALGDADWRYGGADVHPASVALLACIYTGDYK